MRKSIWLAPLVALALVSCGKSQSVDRPAAEVYTMLASLPGDADAMSLATTFPGTSYWVEPAANKVIWHFVREGEGEYGRYVAEVSENGSSKTTVTTHFEEGGGGANISFLRDIAQIAGDASIAAALSGRAVDRDAVQAEIRQHYINNPMAGQMATIETVSDEMKRQAPPDRCKEGTPEEQDSWVCQKHGKNINGDTGVITDAETGEVIGHVGDEDQ